MRIFLEQEAIEAIADKGNFGVAWLLFAFPLWYRKTRVWVDRRDAHRARALLAEYDERQCERPMAPVDATAAAGRIMVVCEECGKTSWFPVSQRGTTQDCPFCYAFVDVGDVEPPGEPSARDPLPDE